jgi:uncharacterized membrane protein
MTEIRTSDYPSASTFLTIRWNLLLLKTLLTEMQINRHGCHSTPPDSQRLNIFSFNLFVTLNVSTFAYLTELQIPEKDMWKALFVSRIAVLTLLFCPMSYICSVPISMATTDVSFGPDDGNMPINHGIANS